jgi:hypothetical protein
MDKETTLTSPKFKTKLERDLALEIADMMLDELADYPVEYVEEVPTVSEAEN